MHGVLACCKALVVHLLNIRNLLNRLLPFDFAQDRAVCFLTKSYVSLCCTLG